MECKNVHLIKGRSSDTINGVLKMYENESGICIEERPTLLQQATIVGKTAAEYPDELLGAIGTSVLKAVMNVKCNTKTSFGNTVSKNIAEEVRELWSVQIQDMRDVSLTQVNLKITMKNGNIYTLLFPSVYQAQKWLKVLTKLKNGEKVFIW